MTEEFYPLETDIPLPESHAGVHRAKAAAIRNLFKNGEIGNSIWLPVSKNQLWRLMKRLPLPGRGYYTARPEMKDGADGFRVWKTRQFPKAPS